MKTLIAMAVTIGVFVLKQPSPAPEETKCKKCTHTEFNKLIHGNTQYIQKPPHLLQILHFVSAANTFYCVFRAQRSCLVAANVVRF